MSTVFVMQAGVLVPAVARVPKAFMVQAAAVGPLAEDRVADGSCGSRRSFGKDLVAAQLKQLALRRRVGWWLVFSSRIFGRASCGR